jgi:hypothetical protein
LGVEVNAGLVNLDEFEGVFVDLGLLLVRANFAGEDMYHIMCSNEHTVEQFPPQLATYVITGPIPCGQVVHWNWTVPPAGTVALTLAFTAFLWQTMFEVLGVMLVHMHH